MIWNLELVSVGCFELINGLQILSLSPQRHHALYIPQNTDNGRVMSFSKKNYGQYHTWDTFGIYFRPDLRAKVFVGKTIKSIFPSTVPK
jgi:hypothetical protein